MSAVKPSSLIIACASMACIAGCANADLARFAPPGIVKYEDIASEKPQNPEVKARIAERRADKEAGRFPDISRTPGPEDRPAKPSQAEIEAESSALLDLRQSLEDEVAADRQASEAELADDLDQKRTTLEDRLARDNREAAQERRDPIDTGSQEQQ